jgi:alkyl sulfatase BDS1-like metallo-beta-lactamase superfamily hydrolase
MPKDDAPPPAAASAVPVPATVLAHAGDAEAPTRDANEAVASSLPFGDRGAYEDARRGFIGTVPGGVIRTASGTVVWNLGEYGFLDTPEPPPTVNPSLWRLAQLNMANGLFAVTDRVYQVRGLDISNMTIIEGDTGLVIVDTLTTCEVARAALDLYYAHRPRRPVVAVVYTHSHVDHFGGVKGIVSEADVRAGAVRVIAPAGFMAAVGGENVLAGLPMARRAQFQFGGLLPRGPRGQVDAGLGKGIARGTVSLIAPTQTVEQPIETRTIDGVEIVFQLAPETEAPAEMHLFHPGLGVLNMAENATHHLHNFLPLRGSVVRDPRMWSRYIVEAMERFADRTDVLIGQHHWPVWGRGAVREHLARQRDLYKHVHDQALRLMNLGYRPAEIAEVLELPPGLAESWSVRGYYGTVSHNAKAVYQRYLGWYDGHPANLDALPPGHAAKKTVEYMGGADEVIRRARADLARGEYRWVADVTSRVVFSDPSNREARELAAAALEQLGYQAESATWRNAYLYGAQELRHGIAKLPPRPVLSPDVVSAVPTDTLVDLIAIRVNPARAAGYRMRMNWHLADTDERVLLNLERSTLTHVAGKTAPDADASVTTTRATLDRVALGRTTIADALASGALTIEGDAEVVRVFVGMLDEFELMFDVVTPGEGRP